MRLPQRGLRTIKNGYGHPRFHLRLADKSGNHQRSKFSRGPGPANHGARFGNVVANASIRMEISN
jgi:hypothetical protein